MFQEVATLKFSNRNISVPVVLKTWPDVKNYLQVFLQLQSITPRQLDNVIDEEARKNPKGFTKPFEKTFDFMVYNTYKVGEHLVCS